MLKEYGIDFGIFTKHEQAARKSFPADFVNKENILKLKDMYDVDVVVKQDIKYPVDKIEVLVSKEYKEFFSTEEVWAGGEMCTGSNLTIGTFQSLIRKLDRKSKKYDPKFFDKFDVVCVDEISDFLDSKCKFIDIVAADLQRGVNENIGDVMVGSNDTADKAVKCLSVGDGIFLCIDQADLMRDIKLQFIALFGTAN